ncbi:MAG TPA: hypothetical protein VGN54_14945 [Mycobacteriales bacterium]|nr:hypothetical protein [Mycobacteriales bacterium]
MTRLADLSLRVLTAAGLIISGVIHLDLAGNYPVGTPITQQTGFQLQAAGAFLLAATVLLAGLSAGSRGRGRLAGGRSTGGRSILGRLTWGAAAGFAAASLTALLLSRYWGGAGHLPVILPERSWDVGASYVGHPEKVWAAVVEAAATITAVAGLGLSLRRPARAGRRVPAPAR